MISEVTEITYLECGHTITYGGMIADPTGVTARTRKYETREGPCDFCMKQKGGK